MNKRQLDRQKEIKIGRQIDIEIKYRNIYQMNMKDSRQIDKRISG